MDQWSWQSFPYAQAEWVALFPDGASELSQLPAQAASLYYQPLNEQWFLLQVEGDPWLCEMRDGQLWSMYSLIAESAMGVAQWEYAPALSSRRPYFPLHFDLSFGLFFHVLLEGLGGVTLFGIFRVTHSHAEDLRGGGGGAPEEQSRKHEGENSFESHQHTPFG